MIDNSVFQTGYFDRAILFYLRKKKPILDSVNPFIDGLVIPVTLVNNSKSFTYGVNGAILKSSFKIEKQSFTKIYHIAGVKEITSKFSDKAHRLYTYIIHHLEAGNDYVILNAAHYMRTNNVKSLGTFYKALSELKKSNFVSKCDEIENAYWINPEYLFCGSRIAKFEDNTEIVSTITK